MFRSPVGAPDQWTFAATTIQAVNGRHRGLLPALRFTRAGGPADLVAPCPASVRRLEADLPVLELAPFGAAFAPVFAGLRFGAPTIYLQLSSLSGDFVDGAVREGEAIANVASFALAIVFADRIDRDPAFCLAELARAVEATGADTTLRALADQVFVRGPAPGLRLVDAAGRALSGEAVVLELDDRQVPITLGPEHRGDLLAAGGLTRDELARASTVAVRAASTDQPMALVALPGLATGDGRVVVASTTEQIALARLHDWFAPQFASGTRNPLPRFTRGNLVTPFVNGPETFADMFAELAATTAGAAGFHISGYAVRPLDDLLAMSTPAPGTPRTAVEAARLIAGLGGRSCFLPLDFFQFEDGAEGMVAGIAAALVAVVAGTHTALTLAEGGDRRVDASGIFVMVGVAALVNGLIAAIAAADGGMAELNSQAVSQLNFTEGSGASVCRLAPYPSTVDDNPHAPRDRGPLLALVLEAIRKFNVYHQKVAVIRNSRGFVGYCGGIDLNPDRLDDEKHLAPGPFHDVHARVDGPAVRDLAITFDERWAVDGEGPPAFTPPAASELGTPGPHNVQVARTYHLAAPGAPASRRLPFAPNGDRTVLDTMLAAITAARTSIYIEDQYLTPSEEYARVMIEKVRTGGIRSLVIAVPALPDQPFGFIARGDFVRRLREADRERRARDRDDRDIVQVGTMRRRYTSPYTDRVAHSGRVTLDESIPESTARGPIEITLRPAARVPAPPFWISIDGELFYVMGVDALSSHADPRSGSVRVQALRGAETNFVGAGVGPLPRAHAAGAAATVVRFDGVYVHSKIMLVDDVFASIGSANVNRRGFYSDGECNLYMVPDQLRFAADNPIKQLRKRLWAEMFDLPLTVAGPLVDDPVEGAELFRRSAWLGNRFVPYEAGPPVPMVLSLGGGLSDAPADVFTSLMNALLAVDLAAEHQAIFDVIADPGSALERP